VSAFFPLRTKKTKNSSKSRHELYSPLGNNNIGKRGGRPAARGERGKDHARFNGKWEISKKGKEFSRVVFIVTNEKRRLHTPTAAKKINKEKRETFFPLFAANRGGL